MTPVIIPMMVIFSDLGIQFYENCLKKAIEFKEELDEAKVLTGYGKILTNIKVIQSYMYDCMEVKRILFLFSHNFISNIKTSIYCFTCL